jgi:hypothetical protein
MTIDEYLSSIDGDHAPDGLSPYLTALWYEKRGDWKRAHEIVQEIDDVTAAWLHAYLHRREGDLDNAGYWYRQSGKPVARASLDVEWREIVDALFQPAVSGDLSGQ